MAIKDWNLEANEEAGQQEELHQEKAKMIMEDKDWEAWERLQEAQYEEEYRCGKQSIKSCLER